MIKFRKLQNYSRHHEIYSKNFKSVEFIYENNNNLDSPLSYPFNTIHLFEEEITSDDKKISMKLEFLSFRPESDFEQALEKRINSSSTKNFIIDFERHQVLSFSYEMIVKNILRFDVKRQDETLSFFLNISEDFEKKSNIFWMFNESKRQKLMLDNYLQKIILKETQQRNGELVNNMIVYKIPFKRVIYSDHRVSISIKNSKISFTISLHPLTPFTPEVQSNLSNFAKQFNKFHHQGRLIITSSINYVSNFYAFEYTRFNALIPYLIQETYQAIIIPNLNNFALIIKNNPKKVSFAKLSKKELQKEFRLTEEKWKNERKIYERMSSDNKTLFFKARFLINLTKFMRNNTVRYFFKTSAEEIFLGDPESDFDIFDSFFDCLQELAKYRLGFKRTEFIQLFKIFDEKLSYTYEKPLSCILEIYDEGFDLVGLINQDLELTRKGKFIKQGGKFIKLYDSGEKREYSMIDLIKKISLKNFFLNIRDIMESKAGNLVNYFCTEKVLDAQDLQKFVVDRQTAIDRIEISQSCNYPFVLRPIIYFQIPETNQVIFYYRRFKEPLKSTLENFSDPKFSSLIQSLISMLKQLQIRNSRFTCFDLDCIGYSHKDKLKILPKSSSEIDPEFQAPEVKQGRNSIFSLTYSLGVLIRTLALRLNDQTIIDRALRAGKLCTEPNVFRRARIDYIMN